jgi:hypothetical protein
VRGGSSVFGPCSKLSTAPATHVVQLPVCVARSVRAEGLGKEADG